MTNPPDFDDRLSSYLVSSPIRDIDPGAAHIASRARRRTKHRRIAGGALASVALLTSAGVVVNRLQTPGTVRTGAAKVRTADDNTTTTETTAVPQPGIASVLLAGPVNPGGVDPSTLKWPASNITWQRVDSTLSIMNNSGLPGQSVHKEGDTFLAVSTEPGKGKLPTENEAYWPKSALYTSKDGVSWQQRTVPDLAIGGATMSEGTLYAVGSSTATAQVSTTGDGGSVADLLVAVSKDGTTWKNQTLPLDLRGLVSKGAQIVTGPTQIAHVGKTVLVQVTAPVSVNPAKYLPKNVSVDQWGVDQRDGAFIVFGPPSAEATACEAQVRASKDSGSPSPTVFATVPQLTPTTVVADPTPSTVPTAVGPGVLSPACEAALKGPQTIVGTYKFADLGVDPAIIEAAQSPTHLFASTNGGPFVAVKAPDAVAGQYNSTGFLTAVANGFLIGRTNYKVDGIGNQVTTTNVVHSVEGKTWTDFGSFNGQAISSGEVGGNFTMLVSDNLGGVKLMRLKSDGSGFEDVSNSSNPTSAALAIMGYQTSIGEAGFLSSISGAGKFTEVSVKHNGFTFLVTQNPTTGVQNLKATEDATSTVVADGPLVPDEQVDPNLTRDKRIQWSNDGGSNITIVDDKGKTLVSIGISDLFNQINQQQQAEATKSMRILDSQDGVTWSATNVSDLVDLAKVTVIAASNLIVDKDRYIVNLLVARTDGAPPDTITFVGRRS